jgi:hypothetical protein
MNDDFWDTALMPTWARCRAAAARGHYHVVISVAAKDAIVQPSASFVRQLRMDGFTVAGTPSGFCVRWDDPSDPFHAPSRATVAMRLATSVVARDAEAAFEKGALWWAAHHRDHPHRWLPVAGESFHRRRL